jgi:anti-anti-sigma factor
MNGDMVDEVPTVAAHRHEDGVVVVAITGAADSRAMPALQEALTDAIAPGLRRLVVDLSRTTLADSVLLGTLVGAAKRTHAVGGRLLVSGASRDVRRVFEITGLDRVLQLEDNGGHEGRG